MTNFAVPPGSAIHLVGIGGAGMSSLAVLLQSLGYRVTGSDLTGGPVVDSLVASGIKVSIGHQVENVVGAALVVRSAAIPNVNPEIEAAIRQGIKVLNHAEMIGIISRSQRTLAVSGTHGKTTTTAMLSTIMIAAGLDPTALVGGVLPSLGSGARLGNGGFFVVEADEFDRRFHALQPEIAIVTNLEPDHLDYYGTFAAVREAFETFVGLVPSEGWVIVNADSPAAAALADIRPEQSVSFGLTARADWRGAGITANSVGGNDFVVYAHDLLVGRFRLRVPGHHNVSNALAAAVAAGRIGVEFTVAAAALENFSGVQRRLERVGEVAGTVVLDDYAHHPTKIRASLGAVREQHLGRIVCLFQPHLFHRITSLFDGFAIAFADADLVIVTDVYAPVGRGASAGEKTSADLANAIVGTRAIYGGTLADSTDLLIANCRPGDLILIMGAGDVTNSARIVLDRLGGRDETQ